MADPNELKKIDQDLTKTSNLEYDYYLPIAKDGNPPLAISTGDFLRTRNTLIQDGTGGGTEIVDFSDYTLIQVTIDQNTNIDIENVNDEETVYLKLRKGSTDIASFQSDLGFEEIAGSQYGRTNILYEITTANTAAGNKIVIKQVDSQKIGSISSENLSVSGATISSLSYFSYSINHNICTVSCRMNIEATSSISVASITISNWNISIPDTDATIACKATSIDVSTLYATQGEITTTLASVEFSESLGIGDTATVQFTGSFKVN